MLWDEELWPGEDEEEMLGDVEGIAWREDRKLGDEVGMLSGVEGDAGDWG